jgi:dipeptidyl aminopeptidase/acylaminoacyl peptidase
MRKLRLLLALLVLGAALAWLVIREPQNPDTSEVPSFASYAAVGGDLAPSWSRDDGLLIYCKFSDAMPQVYTIPAAGGAATRFESGVGEGCSPVWSRDGNRVAFSSKHSEKFRLMTFFGLANPINIWTANAAGGDARQVTDGLATFLDPAWSPDGSQIAFTAFPGPRIMTMQTAGGEAKLLSNGLSPAWSHDGRHLAYFSSHVGGLEAPFSIIVQTVSGGTARPLGSFLLRSNFIFRPSVDWSADDERLLAVQPEGGRWQPIVINVTEDRVEGIVPVAASVTSPRWSHDGERLAYAATDTGHPTHVEVLTLATGQTIQLTPHRRYTTAQLVRYVAADGREIPSWLYLPREADRTKHPALVWLHGGLPGTSGMLDEFDPTIQYFVDQGFVVLAPNYRGSAGFGDDLANFDRLDDIMADLVAAAGYLRGLKAVDGGRIGVIGFSFGGYLTLRCVTEAPELFAAAVDFFGASDVLKYYEQTPAVRDRLKALLGDTPEQNRQAYVAASPINFIQRIKTPLLILHGKRDDVVSYDHSLKFAKALERAGKTFELVTYGSAGHGFFGNHDIDAKQQAMRFLLTHLKWSRNE